VAANLAFNASLAAAAFPIRLWAAALEVRAAGMPHAQCNVQNCWSAARAVAHHRRISESINPCK
jgi:hypothetical protein